MIGDSEKIEPYKELVTLFFVLAIIIMIYPFAWVFSKLIQE